MHGHRVSLQGCARSSRFVPARVKRHPPVENAKRFPTSPVGRCGESPSERRASDGNFPTAFQASAASGRRGQAARRCDGKRQSRRDQRRVLPCDAPSEERCTANDNRRLAEPCATSEAARSVTGRSPGAERAGEREGAKPLRSATERMRGSYVMRLCVTARSVVMRACRAKRGSARASEASEPRGGDEGAAPRGGVGGGGGGR